MAVTDRIVNFGKMIDLSLRTNKVVAKRQAKNASRRAARPVARKATPAPKAKR